MVTARRKNHNDIMPWGCEHVPGIENIYTFFRQCSLFADFLTTELFTILFSLRTSLCLLLSDVHFLAAGADSSPR